jgi:hypothetical protein
MDLPLFLLYFWKINIIEKLARFLMVNMVSIQCLSGFSVLSYREWLWLAQAQSDSLKEKRICWKKLID